MHQETERIVRLALYTGIACTLQLVENVIPSPIPGLKIGSANIVSLILIVRYGFTSAMIVAFLRTLISSLILGTMLSPAFMMSLGGSISSTLIMGLVYALPNTQKTISLIGVSVVGAATHVSIQCLIAYLVLHHAMVFYLLPLLLVSSLIVGTITGIIAQKVAK